MIERNDFDNALRDLAIRYAPKQIVKCGDVVTSGIYWKKPHKVKITGVAVEVSGIDLSIARRAELGLTGWLVVQHEYFGQRLKTNGELAGHSPVFLLTEFTTDDGQEYKRIPSSFNHVGLVFDIQK